MSVISVYRNISFCIHIQYVIQINNAKQWNIYDAISQNCSRSMKILGTAMQTSIIVT